MVVDGICCIICVGLYWISCLNLDLFMKISNRVKFGIFVSIFISLVSVYLNVYRLQNLSPRYIACSPIRTWEQNTREYAFAGWEHQMFKEKCPLVMMVKHYQNICFRYLSNNTVLYRNVTTYLLGIRRTKTHGARPETISLNTVKLSIFRVKHSKILIYPT
jgi:hypothetical protein